MPFGQGPATESCPIVTTLESSAMVSHWLIEHEQGTSGFNTNNTGDHYIIRLLVSTGNNRLKTDTRCILLVLSTELVICPSLTTKNVNHSLGFIITV